MASPRDVETRESSSTKQQEQNNLIGSTNCQRMLRNKKGRKRGMDKTTRADHLKVFD